MRNGSVPRAGWKAAQTGRAAGLIAKFELVFDEVEVSAALVNKLGMIADLNHLALFKHDNLVGVADGAQAVGNDDDRFLLKKAGQVFADDALVLGIQCAGGSCTPPLR